VSLPEKNCPSCGAPINRVTAASDATSAGRVSPWDRPDVADGQTGQTSQTSQAGQTGQPDLAAATKANTALAGAAEFLPGSPVRLGQGEVIWKQYRAVQLRGRSGGEGILYVTDSRVVFYARAKGSGTQRESSMVQQTKLEDVTGLAAYVSHRISLGLLLCTVFAGLVTLIALLTHQALWIFIWLVIFALLLATLFGSGTKHGRAGVVIHARATMASPIGFGYFGSQRGSAFWTAFWLPIRLLFRAYTALDVTFGAPGEDSSELIAELGALIMDLQTRGTLAEGHWGVVNAEAGQRRSRTLN
jgi:hypothetical protein